MQCASRPLAAQPILLTPHRNRLPSPKPFFSSSFPTAARIISLCQSDSKANTSAHSKRLTSSASAAAAKALDTPLDAVDRVEEVEEKQKLGVVVEPLENPRLMLRFIWMEKNIGLALDQVIPRYGTFPLSPYYFWPRKDAWEELKSKIEEKPWISQKRMIILLNQASDIINLWQQEEGGDDDNL